MKYFVNSVCSEATRMGPSNRSYIPDSNLLSIIIFFERLFFYLEGGDTLTNKIKSFPVPIGSFTLNKKHFGLAVNEILRYRQKKLTTLYNRIYIFRSSVDELITGMS